MENKEVPYVEVKNGYYLERIPSDLNIFMVKCPVHLYKGLDEAGNTKLEYVRTDDLFQGSIIECKTFIEMHSSGLIKPQEQN